MLTMDPAALQPVLGDVGAGNARRMSEQYTRRLIVHPDETSGDWSPVIDAAMAARLGHKRRAATAVDMSSNLARQICGALATLYDVPPTVQHADGRSGRVMAEELRRAHFTPIMQTVQPLALGVQDAVVRLDNVNGRLRLREVPAHHILKAESAPGNPGQPVYLEEARWMEIDGKVQQVVEVWDVREGAREVLRYHKGTSTGARVDMPNREPYTFNGRPVMPYVWYHARYTGALWSPWFWCEMFDATVTEAVYWSFFGHRLLNASWPQRYSVGIEFIGGETTADGRKIVTLDPTTVAMGEKTDGYEGQPMIGAFPDGGDLGKFTEAVMTYSRRATSSVGLDASDFQRMSGDPRSGYAITLSTDGKRKAKRRYAPSFRESDELLCSKVARIMKPSGGVWANAATEGYRVTYGAMALTAAERLALLDEIERGRELGAYTEEQARRRLQNAGFYDYLGGESFADGGSANGE